MSRDLSLPLIGHEDLSDLMRLQLQSCQDLPFASAPIDVVPIQNLHDSGKFGHQVRGVGA